ncbi:MAG: hypothetical protein ABIR79_15955 [Candidatus Binatia bacterium]
MIEISLIQKFVLFLGYPTYSLTVVLCALLTSSGCGSFLTGCLRTPPAARFIPVLAASLVLVPLGLVMVNGARRWSEPFWR